MSCANHQFANQADALDAFMRETRTSLERAQAVLNASEWDYLAAKQLFHSHQIEAWRAMPHSLCAALERLPLDVRESILQQDCDGFPLDLFNIRAETLHFSECIHLGLVALRAFAQRQRGDFEYNASHRQWRESFSRIVHLGETVALPLHKQWTRACLCLIEAYNSRARSRGDGSAFETARKRLVELLHQTLPAAEAAHPLLLHGVVEDVVSQHVSNGRVQAQTALHFAASMGDLALLESLLVCKARMDILGNFGKSVLHIGVNEAAIVNALIKASGEDAVRFVEQTDAYGMTTLHRCTSAHSARLLLAVSPRLAFITDKQGNTPLLSSVYHTDMVEVLLLAVAEDTTTTESVKLVEHANVLGQTALHRCTNATSARLLLAVSPRLALFTDKQGNTPLHLSVNFPDMVDALLSAAAALTTTEHAKLLVGQINLLGQTALHLCRDASITRALLAVSPNSALVQCNAGNTLLHIQVMLGHADNFRLLMEAYSSDSHVVINAMGQTPLHLASLFQRNNLLSSFLIPSQLALVRDHQQRTILHYALTTNVFDVLDDSLRALVVGAGECGTSVINLDWLSTLDKASRADLIGARDVDGRSAFHYCALLGEVPVRVFETLLLAGAQADAQDKNGDTAMHILCLRGKSASAHQLIRRCWIGPISLRNLTGKTALCLLQTDGEREELKQASALASIATLDLATGPWKRFPRELRQALRRFFI